MPRRGSPTLLAITSPRVQQSILRRQLERSPYWHVEVNGFGLAVIRDALGNDPLRDPDSLTALRNVHLAANAPTLREAVLALVRRLETIHGGWSRDEQLCALAWTAIYCCRPPLADELKLAKEGGQVHIDLQDAA